MSDWAKKKAIQVAEDFYDRLRKQPTSLPALLEAAFVDIRNDALEEAVNAVLRVFATSDGLSAAELTAAIRSLKDKA